MLILHCCNAGLQAVYTVSQLLYNHIDCMTHTVNFTLHRFPQECHNKEQKRHLQSKTQSLSGLWIEQFVETVLS